MRRRIKGERLRLFANVKKLNGFEARVIHAIVFGIFHQAGPIPEGGVGTHGQGIEERVMRIMVKLVPVDKNGRFSVNFCLTRNLLPALLGFSKKAVAAPALFQRGKGLKVSRGRNGYLQGTILHLERWGTGHTVYDAYPAWEVLRKVIVAVVAFGTPPKCNQKDGPSQGANDDDAINELEVSKFHAANLQNPFHPGIIKKRKQPACKPDSVICRSRPPSFI
jgi:hypothetical protein